MNKKFLDIKNAFSLAETLICLVIIGVVAVIIIAVLSPTKAGITGYFIDNKEVGVCQWGLNSKGTDVECKKRKIFLSHAPKYQPEPTVTDIKSNNITTISCLEISDVSELIKLQKTSKGTESEGSQAISGCYVLMDDINMQKTKVLNKDNKYTRIDINTANSECTTGTPDATHPYKCPLAAGEYVWEGIEKFTGQFLGNGKIVYNLENKPLFKILGSAAVVQDFGIHNSTYNAKNLDKVGFLANEVKNDNNTTLNLRNIYLKNASVANGDNKQTVGGLIGYSDAPVTLKLAYVDAKQEAAGGFIGQIDGSTQFSKCYLSSDITSKAKYVGGFVGLNKKDAKIELSSNRLGKIVSGGTAVAANGGFIGSVNGDKITITESFVNTTIGDVTNKATSAGGFIGSHSGTLNVDDSYAVGKVYATDNAGGYVGSAGKAMTLNHDYSFINVNGNTQGVFVGKANSAINYCGLVYDKEINDTETSSIPAFGSSTTATKSTACALTDENALISVKKAINGYPFSYFEQAGFNSSEIWKDTLPRPTLKRNPEELAANKGQFDCEIAEVSNDDKLKNKAKCIVFQTGQQLEALSNSDPKYFGSDHKYYLMNNINMYDRTNFKPIGTDSSFKAEFHGTDAAGGGPYTISNLSIESNGECVGFFSKLENATVEKVQLKDFVVTNKNTDGSTGILAGCVANSTISDSTVQETSAGKNKSSGGKNVGGFVGTAEESTIDTDSGTCSASGNVSGLQNVGGFIGKLESGTTISSCHYDCDSCTVKSTAKNAAYTISVGGFAGFAEATTCGTNAFTNCKTNAKVEGGTTSSDNLATGGFIGQNYLTTISDCTAEGTVSGGKATGTANALTGGFVGWNYGGSIKGCNANGTVNGGSADGGAATGGFVGQNQIESSTCLAKISNSTSSGNVVGSTSQATNAYVGGFAGLSITGDFDNCETSATKVTGTPAKVDSDTGGFIGHSDKGTQIEDTCKISEGTGLSVVGKKGGQYSWTGGFAGRCYGGYIKSEDTATVDVNTVWSTDEEKNAAKKVQSGSGACTSSSWYNSVTCKDGNSEAKGDTLYKTTLGRNEVCDVAGISGTICHEQSDPVNIDKFINTVAVQKESDLTAKGYECAVVGSDGYLANSGNKIIIWKPEQLRALAKSVNDKIGSYSTGDYVLTADIDLNNEEWDPIGYDIKIDRRLKIDSNKQFKGLFDGNGYTIKNVKITKTGKDYYNFGFFGTLSNASIKNTGFLESHISLNGHRIGSISGFVSDSSISNCFVKDSSVSQNKAYCNCAAIDAGSAVICKNGAYDMDGWSRDAAFADIGGLLGDAENTTIEKSYYDGRIYSKAESTGGLLGHGYNAKIEKCYVAGAITVDNDNIGGFIGNGDNNKVKDSYMAANLSQNTYGRTCSDRSSTQTIGGIMGWVGGKDCSIENVYLCGQILKTGIKHYNTKYGRDWCTVTNFHDLRRDTNCVSKGQNEVKK